MTDTRLTIYTDTDRHGNWIFVDNGGNILDEYKFDTQDEARKAARKIWPADSVWRGRPEGDNWSIVI